jgi:hypothetical protein
MAKIVVGNAPINVGETLGPLGRGVILIQNLGPGKLYMDRLDDVTTTTSFEIAVGGVYETVSSGGDTTVHLISDGTSDVRIVTI